MIYLLQTTCYAALLFGIYLLILRNRAAHAWSRAWLLVCAVLPFLIPFITVPALTNSLPIAAQRYLIALPEVTVIAAPLSKGGEAYPWITLVYTAIATLLLGRALLQYISFRRFIAAHKAQQVNDVKVVYDKDTEPGSFGNYIFLPGTDSDAAIFEHEQAHIKLRHSADIVLLRLLTIAFWPNVMLYVLGRELRLAHEFQADARSAADKRSYIGILLGSAFQTNRFTFTHTFFHHPLKRRIMMLQRSSLSSARIRVIAIKTCSIAAVTIAGIVCIQSCKPQDNRQVTTTAQQLAGSKEIHKTAEKMPESSVDLGKYLGENLKYPEVALKNNIEGRVVVKFVVDENGEVTDLSIVQSNRSGTANGAGKDHNTESETAAAASKAMEAEALRVISAMPKWKPGEKHGQKVAVYMHLPISFRLN